MTEYGKGFADYSGRDFGKEFMMDKFGTDNPLGLPVKEETPAQPSPLPWELTKNGIYDADGQEVDLEFDNVNLRFIVSCCNSHAALVEALKDIIEAADKSDNVPYRLLDEIESASKILAALAAAGKE